MRDPVAGEDGIPVSPFASFVDLPADADPISALVEVSVGLHESKALSGGGRDYPLRNSMGRRGYSRDPSQGGREHLVYVVLVGCNGGRSQFFMLDTARDTEEQVDGELRGIVQSLRAP